MSIDTLGLHLNWGVWGGFPTGTAERSGEGFLPLLALLRSLMGTIAYCLFF